MAPLLAFMAIAFVSAQSLFSLASVDRSAGLSAISVQGERETKVVRPSGVSDSTALFSVKPMELALGENAWAVQILSRGGFIGAGRGSLTATSQGNLAWDGPGGSCSRMLSEPALQTLGKLVLSADASASWNDVKLISVCGDCYVTSMLLPRRERDGVERTYRLAWDDASEAQIPADALRIYQAFIEHAGCKPQPEKSGSDNPRKND